jgi:hypothetical protein
LEEPLVYDRTTTRLVEQNYRAYRLFTKPTPTPPACGPAPATAEEQGTEASS